jgi:probable F420-dependent oxidoreductase
MDFGVSIPHTGRLAEPGYIREFCRAAEELGYLGLWAVDHLVLPPHTDSLYTLGRKPAPMADGAMFGLAPMYEMTSTLLWVAGFTSKAWLGTAVAVLPLRNPVLNARMLATLDIYSGGRLLYGVGVGWMKEEADAMQIPWDQRGKRSEEQIALLRRLWMAEGNLVDFEGEFYRFPPIDPEPRPVQRPPRILIGGHSDIALERAGRIGDGWIASGMSPPRVVEHWAKVKQAAVANGRDPDKLLLVAAADVAVQAGTGRDALAEPVEDVIARVRAYRDAGVHHLRLGPRTRAEVSLVPMLRVLAEEVLPVFR